MAIFNKTTEKKAAAPKKVAVSKVVKAKKIETTKLGDRVNVLVRPLISEKAAILAEKNTYVFEVARNTNKIEIAKAVQSLYGVKPVRVNIVNLPATKVFVRGKNGMKSGVRKALVTLKKGDKIEIL